MNTKMIMIMIMRIFFLFLRIVICKSLREALSKGKNLELENITDLTETHPFFWSLWMTTGEDTLSQERFK